VKKGGTYVIQKGDTLSGIAVAAGVSLADLRALNNTEDDKIFAGETLSIPSGGKVPTNTQKSTPKKADPVEPAASEPAPAPMAGSAVEPAAAGSMQVDAVMDHVVYPGETLDDISRQYGVGKSDIMRLNNISDESAVKEGQRLRIPITE
jgi:LysM repeat protein